MTHIVADIETAAIRPTDPRWIARAAELAAEREAKIAELLAEPVTAPRNLRDPAKIAAAVAERTAARDAEVAALRASLAADIEAARMETAKNPYKGGRIVCVSWCIVDDDGTIGPVETISGDGERALLASIAITDDGYVPPFVMHFGETFDSTFIRVRSMMHGLTETARLFGPWQGRSVSRERVIDTAKILPTMGEPLYLSLSALADLLGVERAPDTITGADVPRLWEGSDADRALVVDHCRADVLTLARVWARLREVV